MRTHSPIQHFPIASIDQVLIDGEFDEFETMAFDTDSLNTQHTHDFDDSWNDEDLLDLR